MQERLKRLQGEVDALELRNLRLMEKLCREQREDLERTRLPLAAVYHHISTEKCDLGMRPGNETSSFCSSFIPRPSL